MAYIGIVSSTDSEQLSPNYIGFQPTTQHPQSAFVVDTFTGNGVQTVFPLSNPKPLTSRALLVSIAGDLKVPVTDYNLDSTGNIDFVTAPAAGAYITVHHLIFPKNEATTSIRKLDDISSQFDGLQTQFTLTANGVAANILGQNVLIISIDGVIQEPGVAYTMSGDDVIFSEAPRSISSFYAIDVGTTGIGTPSDATVSSEKLLTDNNPTTGKVLAVNSSGGLTWATVSGSIGATDLDGLSDVSIGPLLAGQVLRYNGSTFVNTKLDYSDLNGPPNLAAVATSGDYNDLTNVPSIPTDLNAFTDSTGLLFNGDYGSLTNLPSIPNQITDLIDIDVVSPANGDVLVWNGLRWINDNLTLNDLGIVDGTAGQVLTTNGSGNFTFTTISGAGGGGSSYILPTASSSVLGGVKIGTGLSIDGSGVVSVTIASSADKLTNGSYDFTLEPQGYIKVPTSQYGTAQMFSNAGIDLLLGTLDSGNFWQLKTNGDLVFPDNTTQTTAYTGDYNDLTNTPTVPTDTNQLTNSAGFITLGDVPAGFSGDYNDLTNTPTLATVATSGDYDDLTNKPALGDISPLNLSGLNTEVLLGDGTFANVGVVGSSTIVVNKALPGSWSGTYNSSGGRLLVTAYASAFVSSGGSYTWALQKNGSNVATGSMYWNTTGSHLPLIPISYVDTSGSVGSATWSIVLGAGMNADSGDNATITITETTGTSSMNVSDLTASGDVNGNILVSTNSTGDEGGEINLAASQNATIGGVVIDSYNDIVRIFEDGGTSKGVQIDLSKAPAGVGGELMWKKTGYVNAGTYLTLDNIKVSVTTSGNRGLSLGAVSTSFVANIGAWYAVPSGNGGSSANNVTYTTTASSSLFNWQFSTEGDTSTYNIFDKTNNRMYRVTLMIAPSWLNNFICIERLV